MAHHIIRRAAVAETTIEPTDILGAKLVGWYDLQALSTLYQDSAKTTPVTSNGDPIGAVEDRSGSGAGDMAAAGTARPTYATTGAFGKPSADMDGIDDVLTATSVAVSDPQTVICVIQDDGTTGTVFDNDNRSGYTIVNYLGAGKTRLFSGGSSDVVIGHPDTTDWILEFVVDSSGGDSLRDDNTSPDSVAVGIGGMDAGETWVMGATLGGGNHFRRYYGELLIIDGTLTAGERTALYGYLQDKWG